MRGSPIVDDDTDVSQATRGRVRKPGPWIHAVNCRHLAAADGFSFDPAIAHVTTTDLPGFESSTVFGLRAAGLVAVLGSPRLRPRDAFAETGLRCARSAVRPRVPGDVSRASVDLHSELSDGKFSRRRKKACITIQWLSNS